MKHIALIAAALVSASPVHALSCMRPDPAASFQRAAASADTYVVLRGSLEFDASLMPQSDGQPQQDDPPAVPARFSGKALSAEGFTIPYQTELYIQPSCAGPWCGGLTMATDVVALARDNGAGVYVIDLGPCRESVFTSTPEVVATFTACMAGGACR